VTAFRRFPPSPTFPPGAAAATPAGAAAIPAGVSGVSATRRRALAALAVGALGSALPAVANAETRPLAATPADAEGPFYPRSLPADRDADLTRVAGRGGVAQGTPLYLSGTVRRADGMPLPGTTVELWQCDALGVYHHVGATEAQDENFQGYGVVVTDAEGRYAFKSIRPVPYPGRPPHLHLKLTPKAGSALTTQLYVRGDGGPTSMFVGRDRDRLSLALAPAAGREPGALAAEYDFVLR
jgi:protocatechuate 3,4-dioxygenase beta subunit